MVANVQEYTTYPASEASFETHEKFFDIQYMASGREMFGVCKRDGLKVKERIEENDLIFTRSRSSLEAYCWRKAT